MSYKKTTSNILSKNDMKKVLKNKPYMVTHWHATPTYINESKTSMALTGFFRGSMVSSAFRQSLGIRASFWVVHSKFNIAESPGYLTKSAVHCLIDNLSLDYSRKQRLLRNLQDVSYPIQLDPDAASYIELEQYEKLFMDNFNGLDQEDHENSEELASAKTISQRLSAAELQASYFEKFKIRARRHLAIMFETKAYIIFNCLLTLVNIGLISAEVSFVFSSV